jgi:NTE family protein
MRIETLLVNPFSLVLSGGGALGIAHLGVLHDMEARKLRPSEIIGTSMGGIIGACLSLGMDEAEIYRQISSFVQVSNWIKFSFSGNAIVDNDKIADIFDALFGNRKINQTEIPLKLITTNLKTGKKRVFTSDDDVYIKDAVLATMAIPGVFEEHTIEGEVYGDGFLCENLGITEASYPYLLAVDVLGEHSFEKELPDNFFKTHNVLEMFERSMRLLIYNQSRTHLAYSNREILLIEPDTKAFSTYQFHKYKEIRTKGLGLLC